MINCPCRFCKHKGCGTYHSICKKYIQWKKDAEIAKEKETNVKATDEIVRVNARERRNRRIPKRT